MRWFSIKSLLGLELEDMEMVCMLPHYTPILNATLGLLAGMVIGLPPILNFGSEQLKAKIVPEVFGGKKFICLAISEAFAGSDVAGLKTTAEKTADGSQYLYTRKSLSLSIDRALDHKRHKEMDHKRDLF
jgi:alkylation response protein AidB-like acyl-CoA dehydrogenase